MGQFNVVGDDPFPDFVQNRIFYPKFCFWDRRRYKIVKSDLKNIIWRYNALNTHSRI